MPDIPNVKLEITSHIYADAVVQVFSELPKTMIFHFHFYKLIMSNGHFLTKLVKESKKQVPAALETGPIKIFLGDAMAEKLSFDSYMITLSCSSPEEPGKIHTAFPMFCNLGVTNFHASCRFSISG
ncbi:hypothetical protein [Flavobacterium wongokense]|uniref:hypothetical protein n=1 Tax=Flavobacterium wongokense TaxID=2910674 RepID=UPI001F480015|nr:hypothetical protein [Flavobacterium sp. WG47]MCF6131942.1 hypothetical protein [Flavobacterium sp. WG47]